MAGQVWRVRDEPKTVEGDRLRFVISGEYVAFGMDGAPVFDTEGPLEQRHIVGAGKVGADAKPLAEGEWSPWVRALPTWVEFELFGRDEPDFHCRVELRDDVPRVVEFGWCARENQSEIRQKHLRAAEVSTITNWVYGLFVVELHDVRRDNPGIVIRAKLGTEQERVIHGLLQDLRAGRRHVNAELLRQVAEVYRANFDKAPAEAVARTFGVKPRMAHEYVRRARERGFLPPTTQGKKKI